MLFCETDMVGVPEVGNGGENGAGWGDIMNLSQWERVYPPPSGVPRSPCRGLAGQGGHKIFNIPQRYRYIFVQID